MLYLETISSSTLELLNELMNFSEFNNLRLVGGTGLALQIGHRKSIDLDLFGEIDFENINTVQLFSTFQNVVSLKKSQHINIYSINDVKVDFVNYSYPWLNAPVVVNKIRLSSVEDIAAMKLAAITGRGSKKDFIDLYFFLKEYSLSELIGFYKSKYFDGSVFLLLKSLTYFNDAENDDPPVMITSIKWNDVKKTILNHVSQYHKTTIG